MVQCPRCLSALTRGVLRCRYCGADARDAESITLSNVSIDGCGRLAEVAELLERLAEIAPEVVEWLRQPAERRGPAPSIRGRRRDEARRIVASLLSAK